MGSVIRFLISLFNLVKKGDIKKIDDAYNAARKEFGELKDDVKKKIDDTFEKGKNAKAVEDRTKDIAKGDPLGEGEGILTLTDKIAKKAENLKKTLDENKVTEKSILEDALDAATGFRKSVGSKDKSKPFQTHRMEFQREDPDYRVLGGSRYAEGNLRTAIRMFLRTEVKEGRLKLPESDQFKIDNYSPMMEDDPIDVFRRYYGEDALEAADDMADSLSRGESMRHYEEIFRSEMPPLKIKTEGAGQYDQSILDAERIMKEAAEDAKNKKVLDEFDIGGRKKNNMGGITRASYAFGTGLKLLRLFGSKKKLKQAIEDAVDNLIPSGDKKVDADMAIDDMLENANIDRDAVDQYDIVDAYGKAYDEILKKDDFTKKLKQLKNKPKPFPKIKDSTFDENMPFDNDAEKLAEIKMSNENFDLEKVIQSSKANERLQLMKKYPGIDEGLLDNIINDPDPQRKAEVLATLDEAMAMGRKGMGTEKIIEVLKSTSRTKQASGGLSYLMGM